MAIVGGILIDVSVGEYNLLSFLYPYFASYFHYQDSSIKPEDAAVIGSVWLLPQIVSGLIGVVVFSVVGYRAGFTMCVLLFFVGQFSSSYITNFSLFAAVYAGPAGFAQGAIGILPLYCVWRYFKES